MAEPMNRDSSEAARPRSATKQLNIVHESQAMPSLHVRVVSGATEQRLSRSAASGTTVLPRSLTGIPGPLDTAACRFQNTQRLNLKTKQSFGRAQQSPRDHYTTQCHRGGMGAHLPLEHKPVGISDSEWKPNPTIDMGPLCAKH